MLFSFQHKMTNEEIKQMYIETDHSLGRYKKVTFNDINIYKDQNADKYSYESTNIYRLAMVNMNKFYDNEELKKPL